MCFFQALVSRWIRGVFLLRACELLDQHYHDHFVSHTTLYIAYLSDMFDTQCVLIVVHLVYRAIGFPAYI